MGKHSNSKRLSLPDIKSMDYKSRKRFEELYLITDEIINGHDDMNYKFDYKLYRKYKQLKEINKRLQEKIINQHCSGCKCHNQLNDGSISMNHSKSSTNKEKKKKNDQSSSNRRTESSSDDEVEEEQMDTNENVPKTRTTDDHVIEEEEEEEEDDGWSNLPILLQEIIQNKVKQNETRNKYLLKVGLYPAISKLLCDTSLDSLNYQSIRKEIRPLFLNHVVHNQKNDSKIFSRVLDQIRDIHQSYMLEFYKDQDKEESKANRKKQHQRKSL